MAVPNDVQLAKRGYLELPLKRLARHADLSGFEIDAVRNLRGVRSKAVRGQTISPEDGNEIQFVLEGWAARETISPAGHPQMFELVLPGDLIGRLPSVSGYPAHSCRALTNVTVIDASSLSGLGPDGATLYPGIVKAVEGFAQEQNRRLLEHVVRLVSRSASDSIGHLMLELYRRHAEIGLAEGERFPLIVGQSCLGAMLGLSSVHVNRSFKKLRELGQIRVEAGWARVTQPTEHLEQVGHSSQH